MEAARRAKQFSPATRMPDGLLGAFDETQTRDLVGYLRSKEPPRAESK